MFLALDRDMNGTLSKQELKEYADGSLTEIFIERGREEVASCANSKMVKILTFTFSLSTGFIQLIFFMLLLVFDEHVRRGKSGGGNSREMDFESFLDFVLALENKDTPEGLTYLFGVLISMEEDFSQRLIYTLCSG